MKIGRWLFITQRPGRTGFYRAKERCRDRFQAVGLLTSSLLPQLFYTGTNAFHE